MTATGDYTALIHQVAPDPDRHNAACPSGLAADADIAPLLPNSEPPRVNLVVASMVLTQQTIMSTTATEPNAVPASSGSIKERNARRDRIFGRSGIFTRRVCCASCP